MGAGLVCHTLNPRLSVAHLAAMINEAENRALVIAEDFRGLEPGGEADGIAVSGGGRGGGGRRGFHGPDDTSRRVFRLLEAGRYATRENL